MKNKTIFLITPIGKKGTEPYNKYLAICKDLIEPTVKSVDSEFKVIRADQIAKPGSFVKDILEHIRNSHIVIANLTGLNPNVFYELGVRHCLSARTIMITEDLSTLPSDLKEYRTIEYSPEITGISDFTSELKKSIEEIIQNPETPDNPVLDRIGKIINSREVQLQEEIETLNNKLNNKEKSTIKGLKGDTIQRRIERFLSIWKAQTGDSLIQEWHETDENGKELKYYIKRPEGNFSYYFLDDKDGEEYCLVISIHNVPRVLETDFADIRVMIAKYDSVGTAKFRFVIASEEDLNTQKDKGKKFFENALKLAKVKKKSRFSLELWDTSDIEKIERELGIRI